MAELVTVAELEAELQEAEAKIQNLNKGLDDVRNDITKEEAKEKPSDDSLKDLREREAVIKVGLAFATSSRNCTQVRLEIVREFEASRQLLR